MIYDGGLYAQKQQFFVDLENFNEKDKYDYKKEKSLIDGLTNILDKAPLGTLGSEFTSKIKEVFFKKVSDYHLRDLFKLYNLVEDFLSHGDVCYLESINKEILKSKEWKSPLDKEFLKKICLSNNSQLAEVFKQNYPSASLSLFDADNQPEYLVELENKKNNTINQFSDKKALEHAAIFTQRRIRGKLRQKHAIACISKLHCNNSTEKAIAAIKDANTPYRPKKCSPQLADRIMKAAVSVKLYSTIKHLASTQNLPQIIDTCLFGRENLLDSLMTFRPAALYHSDVEQGDGNVICFGPELIDEKCLYNRTTGLVFDSDKILNTRNPAMFFKQRDLGYDPQKYSDICLGNMSFSITHTKSLRCGQSYHTNLQIKEPYTWTLDYYSEIPNCTFISYNMPQMDQILTLNFFRFIDTLNDVCCNVSPDKTNQIYNEIAKLDDNQLVAFLTDVGKKISYTSEFNFTGAYKIDLDALTELQFYQDKYMHHSIKISDLKAGSEKSWNQLKEYAPELLNSKLFMEHMQQKV